MNHHQGFKLSLLKSLLSGFSSDDEKLATIDKLRSCVSRSNFEVKTIPLQDITNWRFTSGSGILQHVSGRFFSIEGVRATTNFGTLSTWDQPIINQSEIGILGLLVRVNNGVCEFLLQAKIEPGNINGAQFSPTIQATKSNFQQVHGGRSPPYLDIFLNVNSENVVSDVLQSEQGGRFYKKRNRNIIVYVDEFIEVRNDFVWLTLGKIKDLLTENNLVNMDTRSVISTIDYFLDLNGIQGDLTDTKFHKLTDNPFFSSGLYQSISVNSSSYINHLLTNFKFNTDLFVEKVSLADLKDWWFNNGVISRQDNRFFKIIGVDVCIENREVENWQQPMVQPVDIGVIAVIVVEFNGVAHLLVQAKLEIGNFDTFEFGPTVQVVPSYSDEDNNIPFLNDVLNASADNVLFDSILSEEGGRFYQEENRYMIIRGSNLEMNNIDGPFIWITLHQLISDSHYNNRLNIQLRSLISAFFPI